MKLLVIALDGFPYEWIDKLDLGEMKLECGRLRSTIPFGTPMAWSSFITGKDPGAHGIIGFFKRSSKSPEDQGHLISSKDIIGESLWKKLSDMGLKVGVFGVPMTYPPEKINGFMISGFPIPPNAKGTTFPDGLQIHEPADLPNHNTNWIDLWHRIERREYDTSNLIQAFPNLDFLMVHFIEIDKLFHEFLEINDQTLVINHFVDNVCLHLTRIIREARSQGILILSDHGMRPAKNIFLIDTWLLRNGYLSLKRGLPHKLRYLLLRLGFSPENAFKLLPRNYTKSLVYGSQQEPWFAEKFKPSVGKRLLLWLLLDKRRDIDWEKSKAHAFRGEGVAMIYAKDTSIIPEMREKLSRFLQETHVGSELYSPNRENFEIPDLVAFDPSGDKVVVTNPRFFSSAKIVTEKYANPTESYHSPDGIILSNIGMVENIKDVHDLILNWFKPKAVGGLIGAYIQAE